MDLGEVEVQSGVSRNRGCPRDAVIGSVPKVEGAEMSVGTEWIAPTTAIVAVAALVVAVVAQVITYRLTRRSWRENLAAGLKNQREAMRLQVRENARRDLSDSLGRWARWLFDAYVLVGILEDIFSEVVRGDVSADDVESVRQHILDDFRARQNELKTLSETSGLLRDYTPVFAFSWQLCARYQLAEMSTRQYWDAALKDVQDNSGPGRLSQGLVDRLAKAESELKEIHAAFNDLRTWIQVTTFSEHVDDAGKVAGRASVSLESARRIFQPGGEWGELWAVRGLALNLMDIYGTVEPGVDASGDVPDRDTAPS